MKVNWEMFDTMTEQNRNGQAYMSHQFNWEWATVLCNWRAPRRFTGLYMPLTNKAFDRLYLKLRARSGTQLIRVQDMQKKWHKCNNKKYFGDLLLTKIQVILNEYRGMILCIGKQLF